MTQAEITLVKCTRCGGSGEGKTEFDGWADVIDKINAMPRADGTVPKNPPKVNRSCVRCSGSGEHGVECVECGGPRPSHTYLCSTKNWPSEEAPASDEDRAKIDAEHLVAAAAYARGENPGYGAAWDYMTKPGGWLDRNGKIKEKAQ